MLRALYLLLCSGIATSAQAQDNTITSLNIGDPAPEFRVSKWFKGEPVHTFEKGKIYVLEFWATWCKPCIAGMPKLSQLASKYKNEVTILAIDVNEQPEMTIERVKEFVDSMQHRMNFAVAADDNRFMATNWIEVLTKREQGIPKTFVINEDGQVAWFGHPSELQSVLQKMLKNEWDIKAASVERNTNNYLAHLDDSLNYELMKYQADAHKPGDPGKPDSALIVINDILKKEPRLKYATYLSSRMFSSLLLVDQKKAYEYGKLAIASSGYDGRAYMSVIRGIEWHADKRNLSPSIYFLGAEAYEAEINGAIYPGLMNLVRRYNRMAEWYWRADKKAKAIAAQEKAISQMKSNARFSAFEISEGESRLKYYRTH